MKVQEKVFVVTLTEKEIGIIENALHKQYKEMKEEKSNKEAHVYVDTNKINDIRELRNSFCSLIGKAYMGIDS